MAADKNQNSPQTITHWNFAVLMGQGVLINARYQVVSANLVLPFLYVAIGAPVFFAGLILPIAQVSNFISQLMVAPLLKERSLRKWYIALALILMATSLAVMALAARNRMSEGLAAMFLLIAAALGISRGISSLAFQDLVGRMLPRQRRGPLLFSQSALAGLFAIVIALLSQVFIAQPDSLSAHLELVWAGIALIALALIAVLCLRETPAAAAAAEDPHLQTERALHGGGWHAFSGQVTEALSTVWFRRFLVVRVLFISVELAMPFYAMHAAALHADKHLSLSSFVIASSVGLIAGGVAWERIGRASVPAVMTLAGLTGAVAGGLAILMEMSPDARSVALHGVVFFLSAVAAQGARIGRRLYLVNATTDAERPRFIAVGNAICGFFGGIMAFAFGAIAHFQHVSWPIWCLVVLNLAAGLYSLRLAPPIAPSEADA
jgi:hypothetical protein